VIAVASGASALEAVALVGNASAIPDTDRAVATEVGGSPVFIAEPTGRPDGHGTPQ
jgi:hypothetical protein